MKKIVALTLTLMTAFSLVACGAKPSEAPSADAAVSDEAVVSDVSSADEAASVDETAVDDTEEFKSNIMFCGSTSLYPIISSLASSFTEEYVTWNNVDAEFPEKNISLYVAPGGSGVGVSAAIDGTADFGMVARAVKDSEKETIGDGYQEYVIAKDALTVSVNAENPITGLTDTLSTDMIRQIFAGEITTWDQVDASLPAEAIQVFIRDLSGGAYEVFQKAIMGDSVVTDAATQSASMTELATNVASNPWAIGYVGFGAYTKANKEATVLTAMKVDGVECTEENIISGEYTVQRPVLMVATSAPTASEQAFLDYIYSQTGYDCVVSNGYIPAFDVK